MKLFSLIKIDENTEKKLLFKKQEIFLPHLNFQICENKEKNWKRKNTNHVEENRSSKNKEKITIISVKKDLKMYKRIDLKIKI